MKGLILNKYFIDTHEKNIGCSKNLELHPLNFFAGAPSEVSVRLQILRGLQVNQTDGTVSDCHDSYSLIYTKPVVSSESLLVQLVCVP